MTDRGDGSGNDPGGAVPPPAEDGADMADRFAPPTGDPWWQIVFEGSRDAIFISDEASRFVAVNRSACELTGYTRDELLGMAIPDLHDDVDLDAYRAYHDRIMAGEPALTRAAVRRKDGSKVETEFWSRAVHVGGRRFLHVVARTLTGRARGDAVGERSEADYREIIENLNDVVYTLALDGTVTYASRSVRNLLGYAPEALVGTPYRALVHPDDLGAVQTAFGEVLAGRLRPREYRLRAENGEYRWVRTSSRAVFEDGEPVALHGVLTDLTESRRAAKALRESEQRYRALFEGAPVGIFTTTSEGGVVSVNPAMAHMLGFASPEAALAHFSDLRSQLYMDAERRDEFVRLLRRDGSVEGFEYEARRQDGTSAWLRMSARVSESVGSGFLIEGFTMEITTSKEAEQALRESEERYRTFFEDDLTADCITQADGTVVDCNRAFVRIFGFADAAEALATNIGELYPDPATRDAVLDRLTECGYLEYYELDLRRRDGQTVHVIANFAAEKGPAGRLERIRAYLFDITRRRQLEVQLRHAQKMEAVGRLAGGVAHDFNNLLQALLSQAQLVRTFAADPERLGSVADDLEEHALRGAALTRQLLLFSRRETARRQRIDLNDVVDRHSKLLRRLVRENIVLEIELADEPLIVVGDAGQLEQVLMNLVVNASDALEGGGRVAIRLGRGATGSLWLAVEDDGPGIPEEIRPQIFEPFFTTKPAGKGTGLGLSVVHGIVLFHGGSIEVEDGPEGGTVFRVVLPPAADAAEADSTASSGEHRRVDLGNGQSVLVVEDESIARYALQELVEALGYEVVAAGSAEEAAAVEDRDFAVLLTDLMLPGASGIDLAKQLRQRWPGLAVILMSGYNEDEVVRRDIAAGELRFLQKPFDMKTLAAELHAAVKARD